MVRNRRPLEALISTEFIFVFPIALTVILAISVPELITPSHISRTGFPQAGILWTPTRS